MLQPVTTYRKLMKRGHEGLAGVGKNAKMLVKAGRGGWTE
jgi:hypothetical protein